MHNGYKITSLTERAQETQILLLSHKKIANFNITNIQMGI